MTRAIKKTALALSVRGRESPMSHTPEISATTAWLRVIALALGAFIFNTTEFVPVGLLSDIAMSFSMETAQTGLMITIYAWVVTLSSLPFMLLTRKIERKRLLTGTFLLFIVSHLLSAFAWSFAVLMISRFGIALSHAVFWSITVSLSIRVAPAGKKAQALGLLSTGTVLAMVAGVPLGRMLGQLMGWRITFLSIAILATLTLLSLIRTLPRLPSQNTGSLSSVPILFRRSSLTRIYVLTILIVTAHFTAYSYIEPFVQDIAGQENSFATVILLLFGGAGILGSFVFSRFGNRHPSLLLTLATLVLASCLALLLPVSTNQPMLSTLGVIWGMAIMIIGLAMQAKVLEAAPDATDVAMSLYSGIYNIGIGGGALLGNQISMHMGMDHIGQTGAMLGFAGFAWSLMVFRGEIGVRTRLTGLLKRN